MSLTQIPDGFGAGGANLSPESGGASLRDVLREHVEAIEDLQAGTIAGDLNVGGGLFSHGSVGEWLSYSPSADIDLAALGSTPIMPSIPGYVLIPSFVRFQITAATGTAGGQPTIKIGNNGNHDNYSSASNAGFTLAKHVSGKNTQISTTIAVVDPMLDLSTPISVQVTIAATGTGGFSWRVRPTIAGVLIPIA
jgi:hypothetical protein